MSSLLRRISLHPVQHRITVQGTDQPVSTERSLPQQQEPKCSTPVLREDEYSPSSAHIGRESVTILEKGKNTVSSAWSKDKGKLVDLNMAPVTGSLILLILCYAGAVEDNNGKPSIPPPEKPGRCPIILFRSCTGEKPLDSCELDKECEGNWKCCWDGCSKKCTKPFTVNAGKCPSPSDLSVGKSSTRDCGGQPVQGPCTLDDDCEEREICCAIDCIPMCVPVD